MTWARFWACLLNCTPGGGVLEAERPRAGSDAVEDILQLDGRRRNPPGEEECAPLLRHSVAAPEERDQPLRQLPVPRGDGDVRDGRVGRLQRDEPLFGSSVALLLLPQSPLLLPQHDQDPVQSDSP